MAKDASGELLMGRYRRLYESFIFGKRINQLSWAAEAFYWRVYSIADDYGNFPADPLMLIPKAGGLRQMIPEEATGYIKEMESKGLIRLYLVNDDDYYAHILSFTKTQPPTGAPRGASFGRKRQYPESPWDDDETSQTVRVNNNTQNTKLLNNKALLVQQAKTVPCHECNQSFAYFELDFDHRPGEVKLFNLAEYSSHTIEEIKAEIKKCDVVCAICHRGITYKRSSERGPATLQSDEHYIHDKDKDKDKDKENIYSVKGMEKREFVLACFMYWQIKLEHPNAHLSPERVRLLESRWKDSSFMDVRLAIDGCASSDFHMGRQPNNPTRYDDILLICRNRAKVEWFGDKVGDKSKKADDRKKRQEESKKRWSSG